MTLPLTLESARRAYAERNRIATMLKHFDIMYPSAISGKGTMGQMRNYRQGELDDLNLSFLAHCNALGWHAVMDYIESADAADEAIRETARLGALERYNPDFTADYRTQLGA